MTATLILDARARLRGPALQGTRSSRLGRSVHSLTLLVGLLVLLRAVRHIWFFNDEFDFFQDRVGGRDVMGLLVPHAEHWSTWPILEFRVVYDLFGMRAFPYLAVVVGLHILNAHLLWRLLRRSGSTEWVAAGLTLVFVFLGEGWENLTWTFQSGFLGSLTCGLGGLLLLTPDSAGTLPTVRREVVGVVLLVLSLPFSGMSLAMVGLCGVAVLLHRGVLRALVTVVPAAVVYAVWYHFHGTDRVPAHHLTAALLAQDVPSALHALGDAVSAWTGVAGSGLPVLGLLVVVLVPRSVSRPHRTALAALLGAGVVFLVLGLGRDQATLGLSSRYEYVALPLLFPAVGAVVSDWLVGEAAPGPRRTAAVLAGLVLVVSQGQLLLSQAQVIQARNDPHRRLLQAAQVLATDGSTLLDDDPDPVYGVTAESLRFWTSQGRWPRVVVAAPDLLLARQRMQVATGGATAAQAQAATSCQDVAAGADATVALTPTTPAVLTSVGSDLQLQTVDGTILSTTADDVHISGGVASAVRSSTTLSVRLEKSTTAFRVCV